MLVIRGTFFETIIHNQRYQHFEPVEDHFGQVHLRGRSIYGMVFTRIIHAFQLCNVDWLVVRWQQFRHFACFTAECWFYYSGARCVLIRYTGYKTNMLWHLKSVRVCVYAFYYGVVEIRQPHLTRSRLLVLRVQAGRS